MNINDYWLELIEESVAEAGLSATEKQIRQIAEDVMIAHEMWCEYNDHIKS